MAVLVGGESPLAERLECQEAGDTGPDRGDGLHGSGLRGDAGAEHTPAAAT